MLFFYCLVELLDPDIIDSLSGHNRQYDLPRWGRSISSISGKYGLSSSAKEISRASDCLSPASILLTSLAISGIINQDT
ncbi:MAG: hypothetical protein GQ507_02675, partial [Dehalococcoidales bacterium]|nr:hypothetical protein [Dehalococcoidales bacterium]